MRLSLGHLAAAVHGELHGPDRSLDGATIDSRNCSDNVLFVAIVAERDGHDFLPSAVEAGASAAMVNRSWFAEHRGDIAPGLGLVVVDDTEQALLAAGTHARRATSATVIGVTGSVGKTSTKDLIAAACRRDRPTHANPASFNNELGLPLTILNAPEETEVLVLEMGARGPGHIAELCEIGRPEIGVVTRVALVHGELFGSIDAVEATKGELVAALPESGTAVLNADDPRVRAMASRTEARILTYGTADHAAVRLSGLELDEALRPRFRLSTPDGEADVGLEVRGAHMAHNAAGAVAAALAVGVSLDDAVAGVAEAKLSSWRMDVRPTPAGGVVINDAYNANPTSMEAALESLLDLRRAGVADRLVAAIGGMAELGDDAARLHREVAERLLGAGVEVVAVAAPAYGSDVVHVDDLDSAAAALAPVGVGTAVLVKASRVAGLERLAALLTEGIQA